MVSNPEGFSNNSPIIVSASGTYKKPIEIKSLHQFSDLFDIKQKTDICQLGSDDMKHKTTQKSTSLWCTIKKKKP